MDYVWHVGVLIGVYSIVALSFNLIAGYAGTLSLAPAAFYGLGAYTGALMALRLSSPFLLNVCCSIVVCAIAGALVGIPSLKIRDDAFVIATFAFQILIINILNNWMTFTGGPMGLPGIPSPNIFGWNISSNLEFLVLTSLFATGAFFLCRRLVESPFGQALKAVREDEVFAHAVGKNVPALKIVVFMIGAAIAAPAGVVYAHYVSFIDPSSFTVMESIFIISIVIIGGAGSLWGPVVGAVVLVSLPEALRFMGMPSGLAANTRQILYGGSLVVCMLWRPQGLVGEFSFRRCRE